ncbi:class F sortase [Symbioplanes lichenis]|uniref:class F sortase n=1 Tax=Symbioplanes lichenis TaxID=1629072 RepID=UPI002738B619|nr:class F sortase [Actinoplanes lichenis]
MRHLLSAAVVLLTVSLAGAASPPRTEPVAVREAAAAVVVPGKWPDPFRESERTLSGPPTRLRVPAAGIDTALERLHLGADGELVPPTGNDRAGWYADGTAPGDVGPAVLAGHVDSRRGPAVFFRLKELRPGDTVEVTRGDEQVRFTVTGSAWYPKSRFPAARVYGPTPDRQLRLITCGGSFDRGARSYRENLVVYAVAG